jgi:hypothetical protein
MTRYLRRVKATMTYIIGENENDWLLIDANTAFLLQGLCPGLSLKDRAFVQMRMLSRELFPAIQDDNIRSQILERLCSIKHVITTIHTFLEDTKYLEPCTRILKKLLPGKSKGSLSQYFNALHSGQPNVKVQITEFTLEDRTLSGSHASWLLYRMLWLFTLRHFPVMDGQAPRKDIGKQNTWRPGLEFRWWVELSALALNNGYRRIRQLYRDRKAADISVIEECVQRILPSNYYKVDQELMRRKVKLINEIIGDIARVEAVITTPELTSAYDNCRPDISDRCGRPRVGALQSDEDYLFFDHIYSTSYDTTPRQYLTSFAITRDFFHSFFGTAEDDLDQPNFFRLPRDNHGGGQEDEGRMQDVDDAEGPPANQRPAPPPPPEVPLPSNPTRPVENTHSTVTTSGTPPMRNSRSPDGYHRFTRRGRSASPTTHSHRSGRRRERSNSTGRQRRRDLTNPRGGDIIFPGAVQQLLPAERTQAAAVSSEDVSTGDMEIVPWAPPSAGPLVENAHTAIAPRSRSLDGRHNISPGGRSASPTTHSHRSGRQRERSDSTDRQRRRDLTSVRSGDSRIRDTIFPGSAQQLLPAGPPIESTQAATVSEDVSIEDMEMVPWAPPSAGQLVNKARTAVASRSRSLDGRRKITQRGRSTSPTIDTHRSERRRERSTSSHRERQRSRGSGTSLEDMEIVQWVPPPRTAAEPLVQHSHSATIPSVSALPAAQPSAAPIFSQEIRDRTFSTLPDIQLSAAPMLTFSEETMVSTLPAAEPSAASTFVFSQEAQSGTVSALAATQPAAAAMSVLRQEIQDRTISALKSSAAPMVISEEKLIEDITISLQDASRLIFRRQIRTAARSFIVLSPAGRDRFRAHKADPTDTVSMVNALQLPSEAPTITLALASDQGKRLKLAAPTTILEEARAQKLDVALVVSRLNAGEVIRQLEDFEEPGEELRHKEPQPSLTVDELKKRNGKPIQISIWDGSNWKIAARNVTYSQTEEKVRYYMYRVKGVRPYDWDGTRLAVEECFHGAQDDSPPTLYLCPPEQASFVFPTNL